ncbi:MAG: outer membrane beta-barrel protein [Smithella sp.]
MKKNIHLYLLLFLMLFSTFLFPNTGVAGDWYVRGTLGYEWSRDANFSDSDCTSTSPPALFGCRNGSDGQSIGAYGDFGHFPVAEAAIGRQLLPWLRADLALAYRFNMEYEGNSNFLSAGSNQPVSAKADSMSGMVNLFVDINGFLPGKKLWRFQPYVGGGFGLAYNRINQMTFLFPENRGAHKISIIPSGDRKDFAFMLAVGTGVILTEHLILDIAYRYFDLGYAGTSSGNMNMDTIPAGIAINSIEARLQTHGPALGLRYYF